MADQRIPTNICLAAFLALAMAAPAAHAQSRDASCSIQMPPPDAGEEATHAKILKVFPRAKNIPAGFSGCQSVWLEMPPTWALAFRLSFTDGRVVKLWTPSYECHYAADKLKTPASTECAPEPPEPMESEPAGCISQHREGDASRPSEECVADEPALTGS
jgi:hypothetical protein